MYDGVGEVGAYSWPAVANREIVPSVKIKDYVRSGLIETKFINGKKNPEYLRSQQLKGLLLLEVNLDVVLGLGGGKASEVFFGTALAQNRLIPLPYCGGQAEKILTQCYTRGSSQSHDRLKYYFDRDIDGNKNIIDIVNRLQNIEKFFNYPYRVFVAFPYGRGEERKKQDDLFSAIERGVKRVADDNPGCYLGAEAVRLDKAFAESREIHPEMFAQIEKSGVVICELTPLNNGCPNANVYFEMGYTKGVSSEKRLVLMAKEGTEIPFDVGHIKVHEWKNLSGLEAECFKIFTELFRKIQCGQRE